MRQPEVCKHQLCDHCGGRFGMVTHRWWGDKFCKRTCKNAYLRENHHTRLVHPSVFHVCWWRLSCRSSCSCLAHAAACVRQRSAGRRVPVSSASVGFNKEPRLGWRPGRGGATASSRSSTRSSYCTSSSPWCPTASCARPCAYRSPSKARTVMRRGRASGSSTRPPNGRQTVSSEPTSRRRGGGPQMLLRMVSWLRPVGSGDNDCMLLQRVQRS